MQQNFSYNVQTLCKKSATKSATKIAQCLCCTFYIATCVYQVSGNSPLLGWILIWGYRLYFSPV